MEQGIKEIQANAQFADHIEPYQRLVELQKQMIKLAQQNERAKRECEELREQVATEVFSRLKAHRSLRQKTNKELKPPGTVAAKSGLVSLIIKEPSTC
ncbi:MAG: hypothetical protein ACREDS_02070 [Limisphaerales bacterium]